MQPYIHEVKYYETDRMGITHHSNYIRWMEEARIDYLSQIGWNYAKLESEGSISPVISVDCKFKKTTVFPEKIVITVSVKEVGGVRFKLAYTMRNENGDIVSEGNSEHIFQDEKGNIIRLKKQLPGFYETLKSLAENQEH